MSTASFARELCDEIDWPPGFRFHPTDEELILYYLKFKICRRKIKLNIIRETDVYKWDPEELPEQSLLKTGDRQWFFFSPRERRYPNAARLSRATRHGYWKATGRDRIIRHNSRDVGVKKTLVFYLGRAPNGERTDWVMHEYTLDEDELKRCKNVQDYYVLYKLFKKSGPGPRNGEQYGALFKEEDWENSECRDFDESDVQQPQVMQIKEVTSVTGERDNGYLPQSANDIEEFMKELENDPVVELPEVDNYIFTLSTVQVDDIEETGSTLVDAYSQDCLFPKADQVLQLSGQTRDFHASFEGTQSEISQWQSLEGEVSSARNLCDDSHLLPEEDFLEIDDLIGPEPTLLTAENPSTNAPPAVLEDGLSELDLFHDANMFLRDLGPVIHGTVSDPFLNSTGNDLANQLNGQSQTQYDTYFDNQVDNHLWKNDEIGHTGNALNLPESHQEFDFQPTLGTGYESPISAMGTKQNQRTQEEAGGSSTWFSSNLWAFVESIPTTPASASENVNRAFERMSSFSRLRLNTLNTNVLVGNSDDAGTITKRVGLNKGLVFFSILGVLCAILWMFIGTGNVKLWERGIAS